MKPAAAESIPDFALESLLNEAQLASANGWLGSLDDPQAEHLAVAVRLRMNDQLRT
jgi:hypothetical protein